MKSSKRDICRQLQDALTDKRALCQMQQVLWLARNSLAVRKALLTDTSSPLADNRALKPIQEVL